jgi:dihydrofolate reductase
MGRIVVSEFVTLDGGDGGPPAGRTRACSPATAEAGAQLKERVGEILVAGTRQLVATLHEHGLLDKYRLMVYPIVLGTGKRLFEDSSAPVSLRLLEAKPAPDTVLLTYRRAGT